VTWDEIQVFHRGRRVDLAGSRLLGISRVALLGVFQGRCRELGVDMRFETAVDPASLPEADLIVVADGANSGLRGSSPRGFGTSTRHGLNRYTWLGTSHVCAGLTFSFVQSANGLFIAHGYPFSDAASSFIIECRAETWQNAALGEKSSPEACDYLAHVFAETLRGQPLLFGRSVRWASFTHVKNEHWHHERMVLIGDAAHAVHFSVGSGTMLAIEDALALVENLGQHGDCGAALEGFEQKRRPALEAFQDLEGMTVARFERMHDYMDLEPLELACLLLSR
jgi:anthraniloyl-CoA monooxygenase